MNLRYQPRVESETYCSISSEVKPANLACLTNLSVLDHLHTRLCDSNCEKLVCNVD